MKKRETITVNIHPSLAKRFREVAQAYDGKVGMCMSAAILLFLRASSSQQADLLKELFDAQIRDEVDALLQQIEEKRVPKARAKQKPPTERG